MSSSAAGAGRGWLGMRAPPIQAIPAVVAFALGALGPLLGVLNGGFDLERAAPAAILCLVAAAVLLLVWPDALPGALPPRIALGALVALALLLCLSILWSPLASVGWTIAIKGVLYLAVFVLAVAITLRSRSAYAAILGIAAGTAVLGLATVVEVATMADPVDMFFNEQLAGRVGYQNGFGTLMAAGLLALIGGWALPSGSWWGAARRTAAAAGLAVTGVALLTSQSRGAVVGAVVGLIVMVAIFRDRLRLAVPVAALALAVAAAFGPSIDLRAAVEEGGAPLDTAIGAWATRFWWVSALIALLGLAHGLLEWRLGVRMPRVTISRRAGRAIAVGAGVLVLGAGIAGAVGAAGELGTGSLPVVQAEDPDTGQRFTSVASNQRLELWEAAGGAVADRPLIGQGVGGFAIWWNQHREVPFPNTLFAHSVYLEIGAEAGLVGLALLVTWIVASGWTLGRALRDNRVRRSPAAILAAILAAWLAAASFDWYWHLPAVTVPAVVAAGVVVGLSASARGTGERRRRRSSAARIGTSGAVVAVAVAGVVFAALPYLADRSIARASDVGVSSPASARAALDRAESLNPYDPRVDELRARLELAEGELLAARRELIEGVRRTPDSYQAWTRLGDFERFVLGRPERALRAYRQALARHRLDPEIERSILRTTEELEERRETERGGNG